MFTHSEACYFDKESASCVFAPLQCGRVSVLLEFYIFRSAVLLASKYSDLLVFV